MYDSIVHNAKLKLGIGDTTEDELLALYANDAVELVNEIRNYAPTIGDDPFEQKFRGVVEDMVVEAYQRRGSEGDISSSVNGISRAFGSASYSHAILSRIPPIVRVRI